MSWKQVFKLVQQDYKVGTRRSLQRSKLQDNIPNLLQSQREHNFLQKITGKNVPFVDKKRTLWKLKGPIFRLQPRWKSLGQILAPQIDAAVLRFRKSRFESEQLSLAAKQNKLDELKERLKKGEEEVLEKRRDLEEKMAVIRMKIRLVVLDAQLEHRLGMAKENPDETRLEEEIRAELELERQREEEKIAGEEKEFTVSDAMKILGFTKKPTIEEVKKKVEILAALNDPGKGGSAYLQNQAEQSAARILAALRTGAIFPGAAADTAKPPPTPEPTATPDPKPA